LSRIRSLLAAASLALVLACAAREGVTTRVVEVPNSATWAGRTRVELEAVWGEPDRVRPDGLGGEILTYTEVRSRRGSVPIDPQRPANGSGTADRMAGLMNQSGGTALVAEAIGEFRVGADGRIYRYRIAPELLGRHELQPPGTLRLDSQPRGGAE